MAKKRKQNRKNELSKKRAVESIRFQTHIGLKQIGRTWKNHSTLTLLGKQDCSLWP